MAERLTFHVYEGGRCLASSPTRKGAEEAIHVLIEERWPDGSPWGCDSLYSIVVYPMEM